MSKPTPDHPRTFKPCLESWYAGALPRPHLVTMYCFDNSHDHRGRGCPTSTSPTSLPAQVRRAGQASRAFTPYTQDRWSLVRKRQRLTKLMNRLFAVQMIFDVLCYRAQLVRYIRQRTKPWGVRMIDVRKWSRSARPITRRL